MTHTEGVAVGRAIKWQLPPEMRRRLKAIHIDQKLHQGHLTIRCFFIAQIAGDPEPIILTTEEL